MPLFSLLLSACTYPVLVNVNATNSRVLGAETTNQASSKIPVPTIIPTLPTATFTETPTLIYMDPTTAITTTDISTETVIPILIPTETLEPILASTQDITGTAPIDTIPKNSLFTTITISGGRVFWGVCEPSYVKITAHITDLSKIYVVTLWLGLRQQDDR